MKYILISAILLSSCSPQISKHFEATTVEGGYNTTVKNDYLNLSFETPSDITFTTSRKVLRKAIRNSDLNLGEVLIHGTTTDPTYEIFISIEEGLPFFSGQAVDDKANKNLVIDLENIVRSSSYRVVNKDLTFLQTKYNY